MEPSDTRRLAVIPYLDGGTDHSTVYAALGVEPIINCRGTFTILGGSVLRSEALRAFEAASGHFVQLDELADGVGRHLARITGAEWGLIASGCAAGIKHVTTACVTGGDPEKLIRVPDLRGFEKRQVIIPAHSRNAYDHAVRNVGVEVVMVDTAEELRQAISPRTAMIYLRTGPVTDPGQPLSLELIADIARPYDTPILADAAAEILTIPNVHLEQGASVAAYSGGKAICGPQSAGIVLGRKDLLQSAWQASAPHHGPGRDDKIGKEEIIGMLASVEAWLTRDHAGEWEAWLGKLDAIARSVAGIPSIATGVTEPKTLGNRAPALTISWDPDQLHITGEEVAEQFARTSPRIAVGSHDEGGRAGIRINPSQMQPGDEAVLIERVRNVFNAPRPPRPTGLSPATVDIGGDWAVTVNYFTSTVQHRWSLRQDGNWIEGRHESRDSTQDIRGTVEGDRVKLRSDAQQPGDNVPFMFSGTATISSETAPVDGLEGSIHLGEYLTATFTARRYPPTDSRQPVTIPGGPPLAT